MSAMQDQSLIDDGKFEQPLKRVVFEPGMLLGVEATSSEQDYHRRRLVRHQYWLHGYGTVAGLALSLDADEEANPDQHMTVRLTVAPGIGLDGLGREVNVHEPYCVNLKEWLEAHADDQGNWMVEHGGYQESDNSLWLKATFRYQEQPSGLQPVMATKINAGTDPVQPSRLKDCVLLELIPDVPQVDDPAFAPWGPPAHIAPMAAGRGHGILPNDPLAGLNGDEQTYFAAHQDGAGLMSMQAALLHGLGQETDALDLMAAEAEVARTLLARIRIELGANRKVISNPARMKVNNLLRPFVTTPGQLAKIVLNSAGSGP
jgi:hypothetical protein